MSYLFEELEAKDEKATTEDKILLMGLQQAGKTAIKDVVFFNKMPGEVEDYMATIHYERQYLDEEKKSLIIDSGGQESYWNEAVTHFRHLVFSNVKLLLWIIDTTRSELFEESERRFSFTIRQFKKENPEGHICVLCHKVDKISPEKLVSLLEKVKDLFSDKKYDIRFEASSIYYTESLKELVFSLMKDAGMDLKRFELITNIGEKVEQSEEFQAYTMEHQDDPRIKQLLEYLHPTTERTLPTFGEESVNVDLSAYGIIEFVLIDKKTFSPIIGTSTQNMVSIDKSMDYIIALQEFKEILKEKASNGDADISIMTSSNNIVHGMIIPLETNYLLVTSFDTITEEKTAVIYDLIKEFSQTAKSDIPLTIETKAKPSVKVEREITPSLTVQAPLVENSAKVKHVKEEKIIAQEIDTSSRFSFLNKLREERETITETIETLEKFAIDETIIKSAEEEILEEKIVEPEIIKPIVEIESVTEVVPEETKAEISDKTEEPIIEETILEVVEEIGAESEIVAEEVIEEKSKSRFLAKLEEEKKIIKETAVEKEEVIEKVPAIKEEKPKSKFLARLKEESKRYQIKQLAIPDPVEGEEKKEKIRISKEDIEGLARYLQKEKGSVPKEIFAKEEEKTSE